MTDLHINPALHDIADLARRQPAGAMLGHSQAAWREKTRLELGLAVDRPIIATGHQTLLWHPGILTKYMVMDAVADAHGFARANLIVDQHVDRFGEFEAPIRRADGSLAVRRVELAHARKDVPMGLQPAFTAPSDSLRLPYAADYVAEGVRRIIHAVNEHADAPNAALQMAMVLSDLMSRWVQPVTHVTATDLVQTSLGRALLTVMADDPHTCAEAYNAAVAQVSEAGIGPLLVRDDYVELPLWRIRGDGRRMRAYDNDAWASLDDPSFPPLLPRALFMTALVRLGMCDVFIHGTGGAAYDKAMEIWIRNWLGIEVAPIAVATATLRLPLMDIDTHELSSAGVADVANVRQANRRAWHDPQSITSNESPGPSKRAMLERINALPVRSPQRKAMFFAMHEELERQREAHRADLETAQQRLVAAQRLAADAEIARRRDWPFPLYPQHMIDDLAAQVRGCLTATAPAGS